MQQNPSKSSFLEGYMRLPEVLSAYPVGRSTWLAGVKRGCYPKPVKLSARVVAWRVSDILALVRGDAS